MAGATVYCATLTATPVSATATADSGGNFSMSFAAIGQPFGCFLTPAGSSNSVPMMFNSSSTNGSMAVSSSDLSLGSVAVTTNGNGSIIASATLPATAALQTTTPAGLSCIAGLWTAASTGSCGGATTNYQLFFAPHPDGTYSAAYTATNATTNSISFTGQITSSSACISSPSSTAGLAVGQPIDDMHADGQVLSGTTIASLSSGACPGGVLLSQPVAAGSYTNLGDGFSVLASCGTTAFNTSSVTYSAANSTAALTYSTACYDVAATNLNSYVCGGSGTENSVGFTASLTPGSACLTNLAFPSVLALTHRLMGTGLTGAPTIIGIPGSCAAGQIKISSNATASGTVTISDIDVPTNNGSRTFRFTATTTNGSPCLSVAWPVAATGQWVADSAGAISGASGTGVTLVAAAAPCTGTYQLSAPAGTAATSAETLYTIPTSDTTYGCCATEGACWDTNGNGYTGAATCPTGTAAQTAWVETDTLPISADCTESWVSAAANCVNWMGAPSACGVGQTASNTPFSSIHSPPGAFLYYGHSNANCAICLPNTTAASNGGCIGYGNVTCTAKSNGSSNQSSNIVVKKL